MLRISIILPVLFFSCAAFSEDAVEAAASCVVIHESSEVDGEKLVTCFENISLERATFESGVCQWKSDAQAAADVRTTTTFLPFCPATYLAYCDRLVIGPGNVAPVKIYLYGQSEDVLARARKQCLSGGGEWRINDEKTE